MQYYMEVSVKCVEWSVCVCVRLGCVCGVDHTLTHLLLPSTDCQDARRATTVGDHGPGKVSAQESKVALAAHALSDFGLLTDRGAAHEQYRSDND